LGSESASNPRNGNEQKGNPLRWVASAGEDMLGFRRQGPGGSGDENPTVRVNPRTKGEAISHKGPSHRNGDSEARCNHGSGTVQPVTGLGRPEMLEVLESSDR
jgi:hypothetical protein